MFTKKTLLLTLSAGMSFSTYVSAGWDFRGEPNSWGTSPMLEVNTNEFRTRQFFSATEDEFKIAHESGWQEAYPNENKIVEPNGYYDITFNQNSKSINTTSVSFCFRGTPNQWTESPMTLDGDGVFHIQQTFESGDDHGGPRFKISRCGSNWSESYPNNDILIEPTDTAFNISFDPTTNTIEALPSQSSWAFRGTTNNWGRSEMQETETHFSICQDFASGDEHGGPRFKLDRLDLPDWQGAIPEQDISVSSNTSYDILLNKNTLDIHTTPRLSNCGIDPEIPTIVDQDRSLIIHDVATLQSGGNPFSLRKTLNKLTESRENVTGIDLFKEIWITQQPQNGNPVGSCEETFNGFSHECRPAEAAQAFGLDGRTPDDYLDKYKTLALVNRFDLADEELKSCGEYRAIYGFHGFTFETSLIIFEARLQNPTPGDIEGCRELQNTWAALTLEEDPDKRALILENMFYNGIRDVYPPVFQTQNYAITEGTGEISGQIRTNMFMNNSIADVSWLLKEFKFETAFDTIHQVPVSNTPFAGLMDESRTDQVAIDFRKNFLDNISSLLHPDQSKFELNMDFPSSNNSQSHGTGEDQIENQYGEFLDFDGEYADQLRDRIAELGSDLSLTQVLNRATSQTCGGCHVPESFGLLDENAIGPNQSSFPTFDRIEHKTHVKTTALNGVFALSPALQFFLIDRKANLEAFLSQ